MNKNFHKTKFNNGLNKLAKKLGVEAKLYFERKEKLKNMAILVTKEQHVLEELLKAHKAKKLKINIPIVIGTTNKLKVICEKFEIQFLLVKDNDQTVREKRILKILEKNNVDFIVLARYMKILSPKFVWNYTNRIINIHPSLLPAFPGAMAYVQVFEKGVRVSGATAHFVTVDLDQGPIIVQESFKVNSNDQLEKIKRLGREAENKALLKAVNLFINNKIFTNPGVNYSILTGLMVTSYSLIDKLGVTNINPIVYFYIYSNFGVFFIFNLKFLINKENIYKGLLTKSKIKEYAIVGISDSTSYLLILYSLTFVEVSYIAPMRNIGIVFSFIIGYLFLNERLRINRIIGCLLIFSGIMITGIGIK